MSELIVLGFDDEYKAEEARLALARMQVEHLVDLEDAAVVVKNKEGKLTLLGLKARGFLVHRLAIT